MKNDAFNLWTHELKMKVYLLEKVHSDIYAGPVVTSFASDTVKEWNNICGLRKGTQSYCKKGVRFPTR